MSGQDKPPVTYVERPANPKLGEYWLLPDFSLRYFCDDGKWRDVLPHFRAGRIIGAELVDLPEAED